MGFYADTGAINTTSATMATASRDAVAAARALASAGSSAQGGIRDAPVGEAIGALEVALLHQLGVAGGAFDYAAAELQGSATAYLHTDSTSAARLGQLDAG